MRLRLQHYSDAFLQTHFGFFVSFVNDVEPKVAQRPSHQFSDAEASRSKGVVAEFVQRWKSLVEAVNASIATGDSSLASTPLVCVRVANLWVQSAALTPRFRPMCSSKPSHSCFCEWVWVALQTIRCMMIPRPDLMLCRYYTRMLDLIKNSSADAQQLLSQVMLRCVALVHSAQ